MLAIGNFWTKPTLGLLKPLFYKGPSFGQCKLYPPVYVDDFENFQLNIRGLHEIREEMLGGNLFKFTPFTVSWILFLYDFLYARLLTLFSHAC